MNIFKSHNLLISALSAMIVFAPAIAAADNSERNRHATNKHHQSQTNRPGHNQTGRVNQHAYRQTHNRHNQHNSVHNNVRHNYSYNPPVTFSYYAPAVVAPHNTNLIFGIRTHNAGIFISH